MVTILVAVEAVVAGTTRAMSGAKTVLLVLVGGFHLIGALLAPVVPGCGDVELAGLDRVVAGSLRVSGAIIATVIGLLISVVRGTVIVAGQENG